MEELNLLEYIPINGKVSCAFADECELVKIDIEDRLPLVFQFRSVDGNYRLFYTTLSGKYSIFHPHPLIYPRKGVYTWENEPKLPNYDEIEVLEINNISMNNITIEIGNEKERCYHYFEGGSLRTTTLSTSYSCKVIPEHLQTQGMKELRKKVINELKQLNNG